MKKLSRIILAGIMSLSLIIVPAAAQRPDDAGSRNRAEIEQVRLQAAARAEAARMTVEDRKAEIMAEIEQRKEKIKQEVCERRQTVLANVMPRLSQGATSVKRAMDTVYGRVTGFYESGQLTVDNYDELVAEVETAKANAEAAITTVDEFEFELDCDNPSLGEQLDGFRTAVKEARTELKAYRQALVALISSLRAEAASNDDDTSADDTSEGNSSEPAETEEEDDE